MEKNEHCQITWHFFIWWSWKTNTDDDEGPYLMLPKFLSFGFLLTKYGEGVWNDICSEPIEV